MLQKIGDRVSVVFVYDSLKAALLPTGVRWHDRLYKINQWGYHHKVKQGTILQHIFSVATASLAFKLRLDTDSLIWYLEEVSDGLAN